VLARRIEQRGKEQRGAADLLLDLELLERQHDRSPVLPHSARQGLGLCRRMRRAVDDDVIERVGKAAEVALGIDHHLLDQARVLLEQAAQQVRFSRAGIPLDKQTCAEQFLDVDRNRLPLGIPAYFNMRPYNDTS